MQILAFTASPRKGGNTEMLLDAVTSGLETGGAKVSKYRLHEIEISPCRGCGNCELEFRCVNDDDFQRFVEQLISCDGLVFASPLYFMNVPAHGKAFIDRCQIFWSAKYRLGKNLFGNRCRPGLFISCGGAESGHGGIPLFRSIGDTMESLFDVLGLEMMESLLFHGVDKKGAISKRDGAIAEAREKGILMVEKIRKLVM